MAVGDNPLDPWGSPGERSLNTKTVDLLLRLVDSGRGLASLMHIEDQRRYTRVEGLWKYHRMAESMILSELGRGKRLKNARDKAAEEFEAPLEEEDEDEDDLSF